MKTETPYIHWEVSDYNTAYEDSVGLEIDGKTEGEIEITKDVKEILEELMEKFKAAFEELDINDYC